MCFSDSKTENAIYIISMVMLFLAVMLLPFAKPQYSALVCCLVILTLIITIAVSENNNGSEGARYHHPHPSVVYSGDDGDDGAVAMTRQRPLMRQQQPPVRAQRLCPSSTLRRAAAASSAANVPGNVWGEGVTCSSDACVDNDPAIVLPVVMEGSAASRDDAPQCGGGVQVLSNLPPFPGVVAAALNGSNGVWRLPEWPADQPSREGTIAAVVSDLPECAEQTPRDIIRNKGLYGIKGNTSCDLLKRSAVADAGFIQPIGARNAFLAYDSYDQLHAKDQFLIPIVTPQKF